MTPSMESPGSVRTLSSAVASVGMTLDLIPAFTMVAEMPVRSTALNTGVAQSTAAPLAMRRSSRDATSAIARASIGSGHTVASWPKNSRVVGVSCIGS